MHQSTDTDDELETLYRVDPNPSRVLRHAPAAPGGRRRGRGRGAGGGTRKGRRRRPNRTGGLMSDHHARRLARARVLVLDRLDRDVRDALPRRRPLALALSSGTQPEGRRRAPGGSRPRGRRACPSRWRRP